MNFDESKKLWKDGFRMAIVCSLCGSVAWSKSPGQFVECSCGKCFVDQNQYILRCGGEVKETIQVRIDETGKRIL